MTYVEDKNGKKQEYKAKDGKTDLKTVVLVNGNSASCSEILAGALKDNGCKLVGETTFGKGVIQSTAELKGRIGIETYHNAVLFAEGQCHSGERHHA